MSKQTHHTHERQYLVVKWVQEGTNCHNFITTPLFYNTGSIIVCHYSHIDPTLAADTCIFIMSTVICERVISAASQSAFITIACHIIKKNRTSAPPKVSRAISNSTWLVIENIQVKYKLWILLHCFNHTSCRKSKLSAGHSSINAGPIIITHCTPPST